MTGFDADDIDVGEPIAELRDLRVDGADGFYDAVWARLARRELGRQWIDGSINMVGQTLLCYVMAVVEAVFGRNREDPEMGD